MSAQQGIDSSIQKDCLLIIFLLSVLLEGMTEHWLERICKFGGDRMSWNQFHGLLCLLCTMKQGHDWEAERMLEG